MDFGDVEVYSCCDKNDELKIKKKKKKAVYQY